MPMTHSGTLVRATNERAPTVPDIALSLSRQPRFGGHTRAWWSVLDHTLFLQSLAKDEGDALRLALLLHDAHEALTGDIPADLKTDDMRGLQHELDIRIMREHFPGGAGAYLQYHEAVKLYDRRALYAEGAVIGPPALTSVSPIIFRELMGGSPLDKDVAILADLIESGRLGKPGVLWLGAESPQVREFCRIHTTLYGRVAVESVAC